MTEAVVHKSSLVDRAMSAVREHIRVNALKVGDTLPGESQFAENLGVSRAVTREAFGALAALRQIDVANGRRARVGAIDGSVMGASLDHAVATAQISVVDVWDVRRTLEVRTAALAAQNRSEAEARSVVSLAAQMAAAGAEDQELLSRLDTKLHQVIAQASRNPLFHQIVRSFEGLMEVAVPRAWATRRTPKQRKEILAVHSRLARCIADGDAAGAAAAMEEHFDQSIADLLRA